MIRQLLFQERAQLPGRHGRYGTGRRTRPVCRLPVRHHVDLGPGTGVNDGTLGAACTGALPRGGPNIPVGVVTELTATSTKLRVINQAGRAITVAVRVNCTVELVAEPTAATRITTAFRGA